MKQNQLPPPPPASPPPPPDVVMRGIDLPVPVIAMGLLGFLIAVCVLVGNVFGADSRVGMNTDGCEFHSPGLPTIDALKAAEPKVAQGQAGYVFDRLPGVAGDYLLVNPGGASISVLEGGAIVDVGGKRYVRANGAALKVQIRGNTAGLKLLRPGYTDDAEVFTREYAASKRPFGGVRWMNWGKTNGNPLVRWADRPLETDLVWSTQAGAPVEPAVRFCVANGLDLYLCVPHQADDDYIRQLARTVRQLVGNAPVNFYIEYTNEGWNPQFSQWKWIEAMGGEKFFADRSYFIAQAFRAEFPNDPRLRPLLGAWVTQVGRTERMVTYLSDRAKAFYGPAVAPYIGTSGMNDRMSPEQLADNALSTAKRWRDQGSGETTASMRRFRALCERLGWRLVAYEGGIDFGQVADWHPKRDEIVAARKAAQSLPAIGETITVYLDWWMRESGGGEFFYYKDFSLWNRSGFWGLSNDATDLGGPKYRDAAASAAKHRRPAGGVVPPPPVEPQTPTTLPTTRPTDPPPAPTILTFEDALRKRNGDVLIEMKPDRVRVRVPLPSAAGLDDTTFEVRGNEVRQ